MAHVLPVLQEAGLLEEALCRGVMFRGRDEK
jgi:hypothetical protein